MTTHKDRPHDKRCMFELYGDDNACDCSNGTRWFNHGHRPNDAIAIQGIATFFARLQPSVGWLCSDSYGEFFSRASADAEYFTSRELYASPVTPAASSQQPACPSCNGTGRLESIQELKMHEVGG